MELISIQSAQPTRNHALTIYGSEDLGENVTEGAFASVTYTHCIISQGRHCDEVRIDKTCKEPECGC